MEGDYTSLLPPRKASKVIVTNSRAESNVEKGTKDVKFVSYVSNDTKQDEWLVRLEHATGIGFGIIDKLSKLLGRRRGSGNGQMASFLLKKGATRWFKGNGRLRREGVR